MIVGGKITLLAISLNRIHDLLRNIRHHFLADAIGEPSLPIRVFVIARRVGGMDQSNQHGNGWQEK
jgi:hypothetical protein